MRRPNRALVVAVFLPFLAGCFGTVVRPVPAPELRASTVMRGVVVGDTIDGERIEFSRVDNISWDDGSVSLIGVLTDAEVPDLVVTRTVPLQDVGGILVRQLDPNKTSIVVTVMGLGFGILTALMIQGQTNSNSRFPDPGS